MKKLSTLAALSLVLCAAACQTDGRGYTITGSVIGGQDGDTVTLLASDPGDLASAQKTVIQNGQFVFKGVQDTALMCYVSWKGDDDSDAATELVEFVLENADITVKLDTTMYVANEVTGTPVNEALTALYRKSQPIHQKADSLANSFHTGTTGEETFYQEMDALYSENVELLKDFVTANITNVAGRTYLVENASIFDDDFVLEQLAAVPESDFSEELTKLRHTYELKAATAVGKDFADIKAATPEGGEFSVSEVAAGAKVLLIDFWASWCGPCRAEMPNVKAAYEQYHPQGFEIIGVSLDNDAAAWKQAIADLGMTWPQISDLQGWESEGAATYNVRAIPATVLIKDGKIVARDLRGKKLAQKVAELLAE